MKDIWRFIKTICVFRVIQNYIYDFSAAVGPSMIPTVSEYGDLLMLDKISPKIRGYHKDDIVILKNPYVPSRNLCKRIIGEGGSEVECEGEKYYVPSGYVWVQGDNKERSLDSRTFGPVPEALLIGKISVKIWPSFQVL